MTLKEFVRKVEERANKFISKTSKIEGAHYLAMKELERELVDQHLDEEDLEDATSFKNILSLLQQAEEKDAELLLYSSLHWQIIKFNINGNYKILETGKLR